AAPAAAPPATCRAEGSCRRERSTTARRAPRSAPPRPPAPPRASRARAISRSARAAPARAAGAAGGRTASRSWRASLLVILGDQPFEQAHAETRAPALVDVGLRRAHGGAGDVEMRPRRLVDEALQELRRGDRAAVAAAGILHVGELRVDHLVEFPAEPHSAHPPAGLLAR